MEDLTYARDYEEDMRTKRMTVALELCRLCEGRLPFWRKLHPWREVPEGGGLRVVLRKEAAFGQGWKAGRGRPQSRNA